MNIINLARKIATEVENNNYVAGHAIFVDRDKYFGASVNKILTEGMLIQDASKGISFTSRRFEPVFEECLENLKYFAESSTGTVIIINIPGDLIKFYDKHCFESLDSSSIVLEPTGKLSNYYKDMYGNPTHIALLPTQFLEGYLNVSENLFVENPNYAFSSKNRDSNIAAFKFLLDDRYENILKQFNESKEPYGLNELLKVQEEKLQKILIVDKKIKCMKRDKLEI